MGSLRLRARVLLGSLPAGLERLLRAAFGGLDAGWWRGAVPWVSAVLAGLAVAGLELVAFQTAADYPPMAAVGVGALGAGLGAWGLPLLPGQSRLRDSLAAQLGAALAGALAGGALGVLLQGPISRAPLLSAGLAGVVGGLLVLGRFRAARDAGGGQALRPVSIAIAGLLVLTLLPLLQAGAEIVVTRAGVGQFVERQVGFSSSLVALDGYAVLRDFEAEPPIDPQDEPGLRPHQWVLMLEGPEDRRIGLVRTVAGSLQFQSRAVVGRVMEEPEAVAAAVDALRDRGERLDDPPSRLLFVPPPAVSVDPDQAEELRSAGELASLDPGSPVRMELRFSGEGLAACAATGDCDARRLGAGSGTWDQLAFDASGDPLIVRTPYPPTLAPALVYGRQTSDPGAVSRFAELPWIREMTGSARLLRGAIVEQDPDLPVDRLWLGPILFGLAALLLLLGQRIGYPVFVGVPSRSTAHVPGQVRALASGRISPPGRSPVDLDATPVTLRSAAGDITISAEDPGLLDIRVPRGLGALSGVEPGELRSLTSRRPVLHAGWYGSQVLLAFDTADERDAAAAMLRPR